MNEHKKSEFEREMDREIESRLKIMEQPGYDLGKKFSKINWIAAITVIFLSIVVTAIGAF